MLGAFYAVDNNGHEIGGWTEFRHLGSNLGETHKVPHNLVVKYDEHLANKEWEPRRYFKDYDGTWKPCILVLGNEEEESETHLVIKRKHFKLNTEQTFAIAKDHVKKFNPDYSLLGYPTNLHGTED